MFPSTHKHLTLMHKRNKYYPIYLLNIEIFKKTGIIDTRLFANESGLISIIRSVVKQYFQDLHVSKHRSYIDLSIIEEFVNYSKIKIEQYFVNYANLCYGVILDGCYIPIEPSFYSANDKLVFKPYLQSEYKNPINQFMSLVSKYNKFVDYVTKREDQLSAVYPKITIFNWLSNNNRITGFISQDGNNQPIRYPCDASIEQAKKIKKMSIKGTADMSIKGTADISIKGTADISIEGTADDEKPISDELYSPDTINKLIFSLKAGKTSQVSIGMKDDIQNSLHRGLYNYYLYQLVLLQFINAFNKQKNKTVRRKLLITIAKTNFQKNTDQLKEVLDELNEDDKVKIKNIISRYLYNHQNKKQLLSDIDQSIFNFDQINAEAIRLLPHDEIVRELKKMSKRFIKVGALPKNFRFPNVLATCDQVDRNNVSYCLAGKFTIPQDQFDEIIEVIAADLVNPVKWRWLFNVVFIEKTIFFFRFIRRPNEHITVEFM